MKDVLSGPFMLSEFNKITVKMLIGLLVPEKIR